MIKKTIFILLLLFLFASVANAQTDTATTTPTNTPTYTPTATFTASKTPTPSRTPTPFQLITYTPTRTPTINLTPSNTPTPTPSPTKTPTQTPTPSVTPTCYGASGNDYSTGWPITFVSNYTTYSGCISASQSHIYYLGYCPGARILLVRNDVRNAGILIGFLAYNEETYCLDVSGATIGDSVSFGSPVSGEKPYALAGGFYYWLVVANSLASVLPYSFDAKWYSASYTPCACETPTQTDTPTVTQTPTSTPTSTPTATPTSAAIYGNLKVSENTTAFSATISATPQPLYEYMYDGNFNLVTIGDSNMTIQIAGVYRVSGSIQFGGTATKTFMLQLYKNGAEVDGLTIKRALGAGGDVGSSGFSGIIPLLADDLLQIYVWSSNGGTSITIFEMDLAINRLYDRP